MVLSPERRQDRLQRFALPQFFRLIHVCLDPAVDFSGEAQARFASILGWQHDIRTNALTY